ncbi:caspase family protein [Ferruginibacter sp.]|nr:caspase family protein [Ferruginibacter sp.]
MIAKKIFYFFVLLLLLCNNEVVAQQLKLGLPLGHTKQVTSAAISPDGKNVITVSADGTAKLWEAGSGKLLHDFKPGGDASIVNITAAHFSPDGNNIILSYENSYRRIVATYSGVDLWDEEYSSLGDISGNNMQHIFSPDGKKIISSDSENVATVYTTGPEKRAVLALKNYRGTISSAAYTPDGKKIVTIFYIIVNSKNKEVPDTGSTGSIFYKYYIKIFDALSGKPLTADRKLEADMLRPEIFFSTDSKKILFATDNSAIIFDVATGKQISALALDTETEYKKYFRFSPGGKWIIAFSGSQYIDSMEHPSLEYANTLTVWDAQTGKKVLKKENIVVFNNAPSFSSDGKKIIVPCGDNTIKTLEVSTGKMLSEIKGFKNIVSTARLSADGKKIVTASYDSSVKIYNAVTGKLITDLSGHAGPVYDAFFSGDGKKIISVSDDQTARIWDGESGRVISELKGRTINFAKAGYSADGKYLVTSTASSEYGWSTQTGRLVYLLPAVTDSMDMNKYPMYSLEHYSPDSTLRLIWAVDIINLDSVNSGSAFNFWSKEKEVYNDIQFSPDSKKLLATTKNNTIKLIDIATQQLLYTFIVLDSTDNIVLTNTGYYKSTPNAAKLLHYVTKDLKIISFAQLDVKYNRPDIVLKAMGSTDTALIESYHKAYEKRIRKLGIDTTSFRDGYSVPEADFANRNMIEYGQKTGKLLIHVKGMDSTFKLDRFNCWINEVPLFGLKGVSINKRNNNKLDTSFTVNLSVGENKIETSITNVNGTESYRKPLLVKYIHDKTQLPKTYFIGIGINNFADSSNNLKWCVQDIRDLTKTMQARYANQFIILDTIFNERVTYSNIKLLKQKLLQTGINDKVIISYSGHGLLSKAYDYYLSSYNVNFEKPEEGGIPYDEFENLLDSIPARERLLLLDACHSGEVDKEEMQKITMAAPELNNNNVTADTAIRGGRVKYINKDSAKLGLVNSFELMQSLFVNVGKGTGAIIISASGGVQFAQERSELGHGVFTYSIIEAMNKYPNIKVSELKKYIGDRVLQLTNGLQKPTTRNETIAVDWNVW